MAVGGDLCELLRTLMRQSVDNDSVHRQTGRLSGEMGINYKYVSTYAQSQHAQRPCWRGHSSSEGMTIAIGLRLTEGVAEHTSWRLGSKQVRKCDEAGKCSTEGREKMAACEFVQKHGRGFAA